MKYQLSSSINLFSKFNLQMQNSSEELVTHIKEDSEYVRLVVSSEAGPTSEPQLQTRTKSFIIWWIKAFAFCVFLLLVSLVLLKWGLPFLFEKVSLLLYFFIFISTSFNFYAYFLNFLSISLKFIDFYKQFI